jgi:hypothetical protein
MGMVSGNGSGEGFPRWWCPRCGTLKTKVGRRVEWEVPRQWEVIKERAMVIITALEDMYSASRDVEERLKEVIREIKT